MTGLVIWQNASGSPDKRQRNRKTHPECGCLFCVRLPKRYQPAVDRFQEMQ